jgi:hypothetical protein
MSINILVVIELELEWIYLVIIICDENLKIISLMDLKLVIIKGYKFLVILN